MRLSPGQIVLDRYEVEGLHDQGGMARVYRAKHIKLGTRVALKVLTFEHDEELVERFNREAQMMARVHHPNVVQILDFGLVQGGLPCIAMEYVDGEPLDMRLVRRGALPWEEAVEVVLGILSGLDAVHATGVLHRDLKPENVIVVPGTVEKPKLIDFGIALQEAAYDRKLTQVGETVGTPAYMSPEQLYGIPLDARSDVYSTALVLYELITQHLPNPSDATEALHMRVTNPLPRPEAPSPMPKVPDALSEAIFEALEPDPNNRPPSARAFANKLRKVRREVRRAEGVGPRSAATPPKREAVTPRSNARENQPTPDMPIGAAKRPAEREQRTWKPPAWARPGSRGRSGDAPPRRAPESSQPQRGPQTGPRTGPTTMELQPRGASRSADLPNRATTSGDYSPWAKAAGLGRPQSTVPPRGGPVSHPGPRIEVRSGPSTQPQPPRGSQQVRTPQAAPYSGSPPLTQPSSQPRSTHRPPPPRREPNPLRMGPPATGGPPSNPPNDPWATTHPPPTPSPPPARPPLASPSRNQLGAPTNERPKRAIDFDAPAARSVADRLADLHGSGPESVAAPTASEGLKNRLLIVAIVPKTKLRLPSEQRWLEAQASGFGRGVVVAGKYFICGVKAMDADAATDVASGFRQALAERYGDASKVAWSRYEEQGNISVNALPPVAQGLMHYMASQG